MPAGLPARASPSLSPPTAKLRHPLPWWYAGAASRPAAWHAFHLSAACTAGGRPKRGGRAPWLGSVSVKPMSSSTTPGSSGSFTCEEGHAISSLSAPLTVCCACSAAHPGPSTAPRFVWRLVQRSARGALLSRLSSPRPGQTGCWLSAAYCCAARIRFAGSLCAASSRPDAGGGARRARAPAPSRWTPPLQRRAAARRPVAGCRQPAPRRRAAARAAAPQTPLHWRPAPGTARAGRAGAAWRSSARARRALRAGQRDVSVLSAERENCGPGKSIMWWLPAAH